MAKRDFDEWYWSDICHCPVCGNMFTVQRMNTRCDVDRSIGGLCGGMVIPTPPELAQPLSAAYRLGGWPAVIALFKGWQNHG